MESSLADACDCFAVEHLSRFIDRWAPDLRLPVSFAGHPVRSDVAADLAFTLSLLADGGVSSVSGIDTRDGVVRALASVRGDEVTTFWSYRVAESLLLFGDGETNEVLAAATTRQRHELESACDSTAHLERLGTDLPTNYAFVLARVEHDRTRLGLADGSGLTRALDACHVALTANSCGFVDDSPHRWGRYDLYLVDGLLVAEPIADLLAPEWRTSFVRAAALSRTVACPTGELITWGRSTGVLSVAATVQVAATALAHGLDDGPVWDRLGRDALATLGRWFTHGLVDVHRRAAADHYRGPSRWLQLTLDIVGKVAGAALLARRGPAMPVTTLPVAPFTDHDELLSLSDRAAVWTFRRGSFAFSLPFVGGPTSDYVAAPHQPGAFEQPAESVLANMTPVVLAGGRRFVARGLPTGVGRIPGGVQATWSGFRQLEPPGGSGSSPPVTLAGSRRATFRVDGRRLVVDDEIDLARPPDAVTLHATDTSARAITLAVELDDGAAAPQLAIDVDGLADYRSHWGRLPVLHQAALATPGPSVRFRWAVESALRVGVTSRHHWYVDTIYRHVSGHTIVGVERDEWPDLAGLDVFHVHWPERIAGRDVGHHGRLIDRLRSARVPIVWTLHNLTPHDGRDGDHELYARWAGAAGAAIHHTRWGMQRAVERYSFAPDCVHRVIRHPHFGHLADAEPEPRDEAARHLGLPQCSLRIGVVGAPRPGRAVGPLVDGVRASGRDDVQLVILSADAPMELAGDLRIVAFPREFVTRPAFNRRLATFDVLAVPHFDDSALGTGVLADAIGRALPVLSTTWGFAVEVLDGAGIALGTTPDEIGETIAALDRPALDASRQRLVALQARDDPVVIAAQHVELLEQVAGAASGDVPPAFTGQTSRG